MQITRRNALVSAGAAVVTGAATAPLAMKAAQAADPVIYLSHQLCAAWKAWMSAQDVFEEAAHRVGLNTCYGDGMVAVETSDGPATWGAESIKAAAEDERLYHRLTPEQRDAALAEIEQQKGEGQEARREHGIESLHQEEQHWKARFWELQARLLDTHATTTRGVLAKLRSFYGDREIATIRTGFDDLPGEYAASIYRDLERLAKEARS